MNVKEVWQNKRFDILFWMLLPVCLMGMIEFTFSLVWGFLMMTLILCRVGNLV